MELIFLGIRKEMSGSSKGILGDHGLCRLGAGASGPTYPPPEPSCGSPVTWEGAEGGPVGLVLLASAWDRGAPQEGGGGGSLPAICPQCTAEGVPLTPAPPFRPPVFRLMCFI